MYSKLHLVPVLKGAVDPRRGIIFRTYYIRPEKLQAMIKKMREIPSKSYVVRIPNYKELEHAIKTGNILPLYSAVSQFPGGKEAWPHIQERYAVFSSSAHVNEHRARFFQSVYNFVVTQDKLAQTAVSKNAAKASYTWKLVVSKTEAVNTPPKRRKRTKVKEQVRILKTLEEIKEFLKQRKEQKKQHLEIELKDEKDYGITVKYQPKLYKTLDGKTTGRKLSALINFLNTNPAKVKVIVSSLIAKTSLSDKYAIVGNTMFKSDIYYRESDFWSEMLLKVLNDIVADVKDRYIPDMEDFYLTLLYRMDRKKGELAVKSLQYSMTPTLIKLINAEIEGLIKSENTKPFHKLVAVATLPQHDLTPEVIRTIVAEISTLPEDEKDSVMGALISILPRKAAYEVFAQLRPSQLRPSVILKHLHEGRFGWQWCLGQVIFSRLFGYHFVPYRHIASHDVDPYSISIATKVVVPYVETNTKKLKEELKKRASVVENMFGKTVEVYKILPKPSAVDRTLFIHLDPVEVFHVKPQKGKTNLKVYVDRSHIVSFDEEEGTVLVVDPLSTIQVTHDALNVNQ